MKKFFGLGKSKNKEDAKDKNGEKQKSAALDSLKQEMKEYKGQIYNPAEDDGITTESLFRVVDGDSGKGYDVRELLGISEEEFKNNPELANALAYMNEIQPVDNDPALKEESKEDENGVMTEETRHKKYF